MKKYDLSSYDRMAWETGLLKERITALELISQKLITEAEQEIYELLAEIEWLNCELEKLKWDNSWNEVSKISFSDSVIHRGSDFNI